MKRKIAVFDVDGTLCKAHLGMEFLREMAAIGAIQGVSQGTFTKQYEEWAQAADRTAYYDQYLDDYYTSRLVGVAKKVFEEVGRQVAVRIAPTFYKSVLAELREHQKDNRAILLISKSPEQAVAYVAKLVGADDFWGWQFNFDKQGKYIDQYTYPDGESDKVAVIKAMAQKHDLNLEDAFGYGDSKGDLSMLEFVGHSVVVNPEPSLLMVAKRNTWRIMEATD